MALAVQEDQGRSNTKAAKVDVFSTTGLVLRERIGIVLRTIINGQRLCQFRNGGYTSLFDGAEEISAVDEI